MEQFYRAMLDLGPTCHCCYFRIVLDIRYGKKLVAPAALDCGSPYESYGAEYYSDRL